AKDAELVERIRNATSQGANLDEIVKDIVEKIEEFKCPSEALMRKPLLALLDEAIPLAKETGNIRLSIMTEVLDRIWGKEKRTGFTHVDLIRIQGRGSFKPGKSSEGPIGKEKQAWNINSLVNDEEFVEQFQSSLKKMQESGVVDTKALADQIWAKMNSFALIRFGGDGGINSVKNIVIKLLSASDLPIDPQTGEVMADSLETKEALTEMMENLRVDLLENTGGYAPTIIDSERNKIPLILKQLREDDKEPKFEVGLLKDMSPVTLTLHADNSPLVAYYNAAKKWFWYDNGQSFSPEQMRAYNTREVMAEPEKFLAPAEEAEPQGAPMKKIESQVVSVRKAEKKEEPQVVPMKKAESQVAPVKEEEPQVVPMKKTASQVFSAKEAELQGGGILGVLKIWFT
ncbi:MAG: hypothetical protein LBS71_00460, partial [Puniceicoccales bacterium]|nr:hypothetical protein [Puniceicoccales bacterium]